MESFGSSFFQRALFEVAIVGALGGIVGTHVLLRKLPFYVVAVSHATFPGVVAASLIGTSLFIGGSVAGLLVALAVAVIGSKKSLDESSVIGVVLAGAFALGVVLLVARPSHGQELTAFLVGSVLSVSDGDLVVTAVVAVVLVAVLIAIHKELIYTAFDPEASHASGLRLTIIDFMLLAVVTISCVVVIPAVGTLMAVALLTVPSLAARLWTDRLISMMALSAIFGMAAGVIGLCASAVWEVAAGGAIAVACTCIYGISFILSDLKKRPSVTQRLQTQVD